MAETSAIASSAPVPASILHLNEIAALRATEPSIVGQLVVELASPARPAIAPESGY